MINRGLNLECDGVHVGFWVWCSTSSSWCRNGVVVVRWVCDVMQMIGDTRVPFNSKSLSNVSLIIELKLINKWNIFKIRYPYPNPAQHISAVQRHTQPITSFIKSLDLWSFTLQLLSRTHWIQTMDALTLGRYEEVAGTLLRWSIRWQQTRIMKMWSFLCSGMLLNGYEWFGSQYYAVCESLASPFSYIMSIPYLVHVNSQLMVKVWMICLVHVYEECFLVQK